MNVYLLFIDKKNFSQLMACIRSSLFVHKQFFTTIVDPSTNGLTKFVWISLQCGF